MAKRTPLIIEISLGLILSVCVSWAYQSRFSLFETLFSLPTYDLLTQFRTVTFDTKAIQIVAIDEASTKTLGRWPWPRALQAELVDQIAVSGAKVIGLNIGYWDSDHSDAPERIQEISQGYKTLIDKHRYAFKKARINLTPFEEFSEYIGTIQAETNGDVVLARSIEDASNVILPMFFVPGEPIENLDPIANVIRSEPMASVVKDLHFPLIPQTKNAALPIEILIRGAMGTGHCNLIEDEDGSVRRIFPLLRYGDTFYPSFAIQILRNYRNISQDIMSWHKGDGYVLGKFHIPVDETGATLIEYAGPAGTFAQHSALDVLSNGISEGVFDKKIVLIGVTTTGGTDSFITPDGSRMTGLEIWANHIQNMLSQNFIIRPDWATNAEWTMLLISALIVIALLPLLKARFGVPIAAIIFISYFFISYFLFNKRGIWINPTHGMFLLVSGFILLVGKRLIFTEKSKELVEAEGVETNKMLGLSFQGQGMLDLAFEKFRKCPVDNPMKELLYNLGLDMERKRQFSKAAAVYEHIAANDPKYKDIKDKIELLKKAGDGALFGPIGKKGSESTVIVEGLAQNTTLGRYEVIKELGRGAMGIVYLGRDPKINRQVAIKTLRFEDETDEEQIKSTKERFFREAESAGNLTHPNIIRIFDAGEDQDVAYIAMELLDGTDLKKYCDKSALLPIPTVLDYIAKIADALDFAHKQGVVHRDIKPGNIMLLKDETLRITDFGIARIQASSKTATGAVLGTPAYMSPEQVNGKKVDGRADLFSLGVTLYEMLTGEKPFQADSIAALLFRIANVDAPTPKEYNSSIPDEVIPIINKALAKTAEARYQSGAEMASEIRDCIRKLKYGDSSSYKPLSSGTPIINEPPPITPDEAPAPLRRDFPSSPAIPHTEQETNHGFYNELEQTFQVGQSDNLTKEPDKIAPTDLQKTIIDQLGDLLTDKTIVEEKTKIDDNHASKS